MPDSADPRPHPTIEERLEAVVQTLELVAAIQRDNDQRWDKRFEKLLHIAEIHERRLSRLEGDQP